jgi:hypothetical protein
LLEIASTYDQKMKTGEGPGNVFMTEAQNMELGVSPIAKTNMVSMQENRLSVDL